MHVLKGTFPALKSGTLLDFRKVEGMGVVGIKRTSTMSLRKEGTFRRLGGNMLRSRVFVHIGVTMNVMCVQFGIWTPTLKSRTFFNLGEVDRFRPIKRALSVLECWALT